MALLHIVTSETAALRKPSSIVEIQQSHRTLAENMQETMIAKRGVGIAAPQVGVNERMAIITQSDPPSPEPTSAKKRKSVVIINPVVRERSEETQTEEEGCLSIAGIYGPVERSETIEIEYTDLEKKKHILRAHGFDARVIQHEIDHLDGMLFVDRIPNPSLLHP